MAIDSWERYVEIAALMQPGGTELDPLEGDARQGPAVELDVEGVPPSRVTACRACGRPRRPRVTRLKGGLCGPCRAAA